MMAPNRIVSLWDMLRLNSSWFVSAIQALALNEEGFRHYTTLEQDHLTSIHKVCVSLKTSIEELGMPATVAALERLRKEAEEGIKIPRLQQLLDNYSHNIIAEMRGKWLIILTGQESAIMNKAKKPFGEKVFATFPEMNDDLEEATLCLGLGRYAASVFHLMRAMERCVHRISTTLTGVKEQKIWGFLLADIKRAVDQMPRGEEKSAWMQAHSLLFSVKEAWRNKVMHPKHAYSEEQAKDVYQATGAFLRHLATLIPPPPAASESA